MSDENWDGKTERRSHNCLKDREWGVLEGTLKNIDATQNRIEENQKAIMSELFGNGNEGLHTSVALNRSSLKRVWWWLSAMSLAVIGAIVSHFAGINSP